MKTERVITLSFIFLSFFLQCITPPVPLLFDRPEGSDVEIYSPGKDLSMIVYPTRNRHIRGSVIFIHGGGWQAAGADMPLFSDWQKLLEKYNLRAFSIEHRTSPDFRGRDLIEDCMDAVKYIRENAKRLNVPADKFALIGFSSGGYLAVMTGIEMNRIKKNSILSVAAFYPPLDFEAIIREGSPQMKKYLREFLPAESSGEWELLTAETESLLPSKNINSSMPKILIVHGEKDKLIQAEESEMFYKNANQKIPGRVKIDIIPGAEHNFNIDRNKKVRAAEKKTVRFVASTMRFRKIKLRLEQMRDNNEELFSDD